MKEKCRDCKAEKRKNYFNFFEEKLEIEKRKFQELQEKFDKELEDKKSVEWQLSALVGTIKNDLGSRGLNETLESRFEEFKLETEKGYSKNSVKEVRNWGLLDREETHIPDLTDQWRRGVIKMLSVTDFSNRGICDDLIVFLVPFSSRSTPRIAINMFNLAEIDSLLQIEYSQGIAEEVKQSNNKIIKSMVKSLLQSSIGSEWEWDVYVLVDKKNGYKSKRNSVGHTSGTSADSAFYLALASACLEVPLSDEVAITGTTELALLERDLQYLELVNSGWYWSWIEKPRLKREIERIKEAPISQWKIKAVGGVGVKVTSAVENGAKIIILPEENRCNYEYEVSDDIKEQIQEVIFIQKITDLDRFLQSQNIAQVEREQYQAQILQPAFKPWNSN